MYTYPTKCRPAQRRACIRMFFIIFFREDHRIAHNKMSLVREAIFRTILESLKSKASPPPHLSLRTVYNEIGLLSSPVSIIFCFVLRCRHRHRHRFYNEFYGIQKPQGCFFYAFNDTVAKPVCPSRWASPKPTETSRTLEVKVQDTWKKACAVRNKARNIDRCEDNTEETMRRQRQ